MTAIASLFKDLYFWISFILFAASVAGILWILKNLKEHQEEETLYIPPAPKTALKPSAPDAESTSRIVTEPKVIYEPANPITMEILSERLSRIEKQVFEISDKIGTGPGNEEMALELKALVQALKSGAGTSADSKALAQLSAKVDKMYKVIVSLSGAEEQP